MNAALPADAPRPRALTLMQAVAAARESVAFMTELPIDQVVAVAPAQEGWSVTIDLVEAAARSGDNDLLATYRVALDASGGVSGIERVRRYRREDAEAAP